MEEGGNDLTFPENPGEKYSSIDASSEYFTTTGEKMNLIVPSEQNSEFKSKAIEKIHIPSLEPKKRAIRSPNFNFSSSPIHYSREEIKRNADKAIAGGVVNMNDPYFISEVIEELSSRRIQLISEGEYKKAKVVVDTISRLRDSFRMDDSKRYKDHHIEDLKEAVKEQERRVKDLQYEQKEKIENRKKEGNAKLRDLQIKQDDERDQLVFEWTSPEKQREFNKQSPQLIKNKALEKYMAFIGQLDNAENLKKENQKMEKMEINEKYQLMVSKFHKAQDKLDENLEQHYEDVKKGIEFGIDVIEENNKIELERAKIKSNILQKRLDKEMKNKKKMPKLNYIQSTRLPLLQKTVDNAVAKNKFRCSGVDQVNAKPLSLPPLVVKQRRKISRSVLV